jgi:hypothetical protein
VFSGYITASTDTTSKSGLYFTDLAGCTVSLLDDLVKEDHADFDECFDYLYKTAQRNLRIDVQKALAQRFHIDKKLITRETSEFKADYNASTGYNGIKIQVSVPKYGRIQILSISVNSQAAFSDAQFTFFKENESGDVLGTVSGDLEAGKNILNVYQDFEEDEIFVAYSGSELVLKETQNKYYDSDSVSIDKGCEFDCGNGDLGLVTQVNGGGLNVKFVLYCSIEKFILENLPLFQFALFYRLGVDTMKERLTTQRVNLTTVLTEDRAKELMAVHNEDYKAALEAATMSIKMNEDPICFMCKKSVSSKVNLP